MVFNKVQVFLTMDPNTQRKNFTNNKLILQASCTFYPMCLILADWNSKSPFIQEMLVACFPLTLLPHNVKKYLSTLGLQWLFIILKNELGLNWKDFQTKNKSHFSYSVVSYKSGLESLLCGTLRFCRRWAGKKISKILF